MKNKTQGRRGAARRLATCLRIDEEEGGEERQKIERKKRDEMGNGEGRDRRSSGGGPEYNASDAGSTSRRLTTTKKDPCTIYWLKNREFMRRFALAGGSTRDEKPKFLSNSPFSLVARSLSYFSSIFIRDSLYTGGLQETGEAGETSC